MNPKITKKIMVMTAFIMVCIIADITRAGDISAWVGYPLGIVND